MLRKLVLLVFVAAAFAGCGNKTATISVAETEGVYVDVGGLTYQVQMSRYLNPYDPEDKEYLRGLPSDTSPIPPKGKTWFGVWMRVKNYSDEALKTSDSFRIIDTENEEFFPIHQDPLTNPFVYEPLVLQHAQVLPPPDTAAASGVIQGSLILFQLTTQSLQNRPLRLEIEQEGAKTGEVDLDL
jgi:hypothetical protein